MDVIRWLLSVTFVKTPSDALWFLVARSRADDCVLEVMLSGSSISVLLSVWSLSTLPNTVGITVTDASWVVTSMTGTSTCRLIEFAGVGNASPCAVLLTGRSAEGSWGRDAWGR